MKLEDVIRYKFFLGTACRDKEVTFAVGNNQVDFLLRYDIGEAVADSLALPGSQQCHQRGEHASSRR